MFHWFETRIDPFPMEHGQPPRSVLAFYWHFIKPVWPVFAVLLVFGCAGALIEVALVAYIGTLIDLMRAAASAEAFFAEHMTLLLWMAFVALIARPAVSVGHDVIKNQVISQPLVTRVRWQTHRYVLRQSLGFFQNDFAGRVANKIMQTGPALRESVVQMIDAIWYVVVQFTGTVVLFAAADRRLVVPLFVWLALYAVTLRWFVPNIQARSFASSEARSMLTGRIVDSYTNILTVKLFAHADREDAYARAANQELLDKAQASMRLVTAMELVLYSLNGLLLVVTTGIALWLWGLGKVTIGDIALITTLTLRIVHMSGWIMWTVTGIFENIGTVQEGVETISRPYDLKDAPGAKPLAVSKGHIRFENIRFHYGKAGGVIDHLSLDIAPGEKVGLIGRSGAGKSTLVGLLLRFYDLEAGRILIDGQDIAKVQQDSLRAQIGMVTQDTSLLHRSVMDNILYGRPAAGEAAAIAAARQAAAHDFVCGLEDVRGRKGYFAHVGERGVKLSGGQRQRIAIARVLLKDAPILVLDEATSALDSEIEAAIQEQLYNLMQGKTVIAIAHRLSTIAAMDRLVIMDKGAIVEEGSHEELIARGGLYADLWARQSGGFVAREAAE